tara:strand:+ start:1037 stop:1189 length:153 start_codon:yes stop_codon:yes gene_type:complete
MPDQLIEDQVKQVLDPENTEGDPLYKIIAYMLLRRFIRVDRRVVPEAVPG